MQSVKKCLQGFPVNPDQEQDTVSAFLAMIRVQLPSVQPLEILALSLTGGREEALLDLEGNEIMFIRVGVGVLIPTWSQGCT